MELFVTYDDINRPLWILNVLSNLLFIIINYLLGPATYLDVGRNDFIS